MPSPLKKVWYIFRQRYGQILLILLLLVVCIVSFKSGKYLLSNDNYSPELNPNLSIARYIESPAWRGYRVLGVPSDSEQADVFRTIFFFITRPFTGTAGASQFYYLLCLVIGTISMAALVSSLVRDSKIRKYYQISYLFSGIVYMTTLWTMWLFYQVMAPYISNFAFFPLLLLTTYKYMRNPSLENIFFVFLSSIFFSSVSVIATLFIVDTLVLLSFLSVVGLSLKRTFWGVVSRIARVIGVFLITQLFWMLPFIHYTVTNSQNVLDSYVNKTITTSTIDLESDMETPMNAARFYNRNVFEMEGEKYVFPMGFEFQTYDFYKVLGFIPAFLSILAIVFAVFKKHKKLLFWGTLALGSWFLIKVLNPPFESLFLWFQENIPLFKQVLRWPFSKLGQIYLVAVTVLSTFGLIYLVSFLSSFSKKGLQRNIFKTILFLLFLLLPLVYSEYIFRGDIFSNRSLVEYPDDYAKLNQYIKNNNAYGRIYYAPPSNNNYFRKNNWGFWGSQFISYVIPNPVMDLSSAVGSNLSEIAMSDLSNVYRSGDKEKFDSLLKKYNVEYVLFDKSLNLEGFSFDLDPQNNIDFLSEYPVVWNSDILDLYKVEKVTDQQYTEAIGSSSTDRNYFVRKNGETPFLNLSNLKLDNLRLTKNKLIGEYSYSGQGAFFRNNLTQEQLGELPTKILLKDDGQIIATPSYPSIQGDDTLLPFRVFNSSKIGYYIIQDHVYTTSQLINGITVNQKYKDFDSIFTLSEDFEVTNLLPEFLNSLGSDCSGNVIVNNTNVVQEEIASGIKIRGSSESPCIYSRLHNLNYGYKYVTRIKFNWEAREGNYPGFCIFSETEKRCLNSEKFFDNKKGFGEQERVIDVVISGSDRMSLILYATNTNNEVSAEVIFKKIELSFSPVTSSLTKLSEGTDYIPREMFLNSGQKYLVETPVIYGNSSYIYDADLERDLLWQPIKESLGNNSIYEISVTDGMKQVAKDQIVNQSVELFLAEPNSKYMLYWNGENVSNIPSSLCLIYEKESKCWFQEMFSADIRKREVRFFESDSVSKFINFVYGSTSYKLVTENVLRDLLVMKYPKEWDTVRYSSGYNKKYTELEVQKTTNSPHSTFYKLDINGDDIEGKNILVTIPQSSNSGWVAVAKVRDGFFKFLNKDSQVLLDGWKQGWDISNNNYENITIFYWPNFLSYFGYLAILFFLIYIPIKIIKQRRYELY